MALAKDLAEGGTPAPQSAAPNKQAPQQESLTDDEEDDLRITVTLAKNLIDQGGIEVIDKAMSSKDPGQIIGQFLMQLMSQLGEALKKFMELSPRILFAHDGWVEQISDYLQDEYDIPKETMDRAEIYIASTAQQMNKNQQAQQAAQQPPAMPQQGGV